MESNFSKNKNSMREDNNQPLPFELDWSNMKDGIFDKMEVIDQKKLSQRNSNGSWKRIGLLLMLFFVLALGLFFIDQKRTKDLDTEEHDAVQLPEVEMLNSASINIGKEAPTNQVEFSSESLVEDNQTSKTNDLQLTYKESAPNQDLAKSAKVDMDIDQSLENQHLTENDPLNKFINTDHGGSTQRSPNTAQNALMKLADTASTKLNVRQRITELQALPRYNFDQTSIEQMNNSSSNIQKMNSLYRRGNRRNKSPNQLILEGGITFWDEGYGNSKPERAQYETPLTSFQLQGHYLRRFKGNFFVIAGLQYQQLKSRFQYNSTIPDFNITLIDTIVQVQNDLLTGEQKIIRGDIEQSVQAERRIRHYNTTKLFKVSMAIGKAWRFNSFQTDVYLGGAINSLVYNQGRTFYQDTIIDYNGASNSLFQNQWTVDGTLGVRLHYFLNQNIALTTGFQIQKSLSNWSNQADINLYPGSFSLQLGMSYSL